MTLTPGEALIWVSPRDEAAACGWWFLLTVFANSEKAAARPGRPGLTSRIATDNSVSVLLGPATSPQTALVVQPVPVQIEGYNEGSMAGYLSPSCFL